MGRYVLEPQIFQELRKSTKGAGGEIQLTDAIVRLLQRRPVLAHRFRGRRFDCGTKRGYWEATMVLGMRHAQIGEYLKHSLQQATIAANVAD